MKNGIKTDFDELYEELSTLNENRADDAFASGEWTQERIDSFDFLYQLAQAIGYKVNGTEIHADAAKAIKAAAAANGFNLDKFKNTSAVPDNAMSDDEWFVNGAKRNGTWTIKRLIALGVPYECAECGVKEWNGKPISLQLHHIDGNHYNNEISNLQLLCPNCHSQTSSYARNKK